MLPPTPQSSIDWTSYESYLWFSLLKDCPQEPEFHGEGSVDIHTRMACEALLASDEWPKLSEERKFLAFHSVLLHDSGKPCTTKPGPDGRLHADGHARVGAIIARKFLWEHKVPFYEREKICRVIELHMKPYFFMTTENPEHEALRLFARTDWQVLVAQAMADTVGRIYAGKDQMVDTIRLLSDYCQELAQKDSLFLNDHSRFVFFRDRPSYIPHIPFFKPRCHVTMMSGLPGSGKDTWIKKSKDCPVVSLDEIRNELHINPDEDQAVVVHAAKERAKELLRAGQDFVWNATNISKSMRSQLVDFFCRYDAEVEIVYVESANVLEQNAQRKASVPSNIMDRLMRKWAVPDLTEAHKITYVIS